MAKILYVGSDNEEQQKLVKELRREDYTWLSLENIEEALSVIEQEAPDIMLVNLVYPVLSSGDLRELLRTSSSHTRIPAVALISENHLPHYDLALGFDDFQLFPCRPSELLTRIKQALWRTGKLARVSEEVLQCGELIIDTNRYEVYLAGRPVELTFKEYELLRFMVSSQDKVLTRELLLNRVWGYDYYGGARTVDVHIRRLRSKIEDKDHAFIETVRNVGYRFRPSAVVE